MKRSDDVRMRGFARRATVPQAFAWIDATARLLPAETVWLPNAAGRVLAAAVSSRHAVPAFVRSAMDGYALRGEETQGASAYQPQPFAIVGESLAGRPFVGEVTTGTCVRIMTGAPLPAGADAVLPVEVTQLTADRMEALEAVPPGKNVGQIGEDVPAGSVIFQAGRRLRPQDVGLLAAVGVTEISCIRRPRVRILTTGNELVLLGAVKGPHQIFDANSGMLAALVTRDGGVHESPQLLPDDREVLRSALRAPGADVVLISGGSSVGAEDHAPTLLAEEGTLAIHGLAMRPSSPAGMGSLGESLVFLLPGNPVSCLCAYDFFAGRAIRMLGGRPADWPYVSRELPLARKLVSSAGRVDYARVRIVEGQVEPIAISGASVLSSTTLADGFVVIPEELEGYGPGTVVTVFLYDA